MNATDPSIPLWRQLQAVAAVLQAIRGGVSGTAALNPVAPELRPGVQALIFHVLRSLGRAQGSLAGVDLLEARQRQPMRERKRALGPDLRADESERVDVPDNCVLDPGRHDDAPHILFGKDIRRLPPGGGAGPGRGATPWRKA